jgi:hypothetical protein
VEERCKKPKVRGHRRLPRKQGEDTLVDLQVATINSVVVSNNQLGKFEVLVRKSLKRPVKRCNYKFEPLERVALKPGDLLLILEAVRRHSCTFHQPNLPVT